MFATPHLDYVCTTSALAVYRRTVNPVVLTKHLHKVKFVGWVISPVRRAVEGQHQLGVLSGFDVGGIAAGDADAVGGGGVGVVVLAVVVVVAVAAVAVAALLSGGRSPRTTPAPR